MRVASFALTALLCSSVAFAQPGSMMGGQGRMGGGMPMAGMMGGHCAMMGRSEGALAFLKTELKITSGQEKAWNDFATAYRQKAAAMPGGMMKGGLGAMKGKGAKGAHMMGMTGGPFPDVMAQRMQMMEQHVASMKAMMGSVKPLYDALSAEQRKTADELLPLFVMMHCGMSAGDE